MKDLLLGVVSLLVALLLLLAGGEIAVRGMHFYTAHLSSGMNPRNLEVDDTLGWVPTRDYAYDGELVDAAGTVYPVMIRIDSEGYRAFGDPLSARKKFLFLGDSFTQAMQVSDDKTYYALLGDVLDIEVFAQGVNGYGTLQQSMLLDQVFDDIRPDAVVVQFCPNDIINNHFGLEQNSAGNNNGLRRPYLEGNEIVYRNPSSFPALRNFAARYSEFLYFIIAKLDRLKQPPSQSSEQLIQQQGLDNADFVESVAAMDNALARIRSRVPADIPVYAFSTNHGAPYHEQFRRVSARNGIEFIDGTSRALREAEAAGVMTRAADKEHWNDAGHRIVADVLGSYLSHDL